MEPISEILAISLFILCVAAPFSMAIQAFHQGLLRPGQQSSHVVRGLVPGMSSNRNERHTSISTTAGFAADRLYQDEKARVFDVLQRGVVAGNGTIKAVRQRHPDNRPFSKLLCYRFCAEEMI